ncbi:alpha/beta hydrolase fold domain-containing protein [Blastococcus sp. TF02A-30]|uniref:alpha/beta hydrolase fold domain-containing protein n=1 Tax=Blastococcus sp. TF02A-30 TaxID=2250580 RepID=UPI000DEA7025|nr:alpha/beta hydrolase fold domain-containing protein [Blastococcus sp. TF02A-30]RBY89582.1 esterase [Blastococcus sp. TF02A-30]
MPVARPQVPVPVMRAAVRALVRPVLGSGLPAPVQRRWLELVSGTSPAAPGVAVRRGTLAGRPVETLVPPDAVPGRAVLYLHGGAFLVGSPRTHRALTTHLAVASRATVHALDYRLAPEHPFPAALDDAVGAWQELLADGAEPEATALVGDSAGGWLALAAALRLRDAGGAQPAVLGLVSPWLDLECSEPTPGVADAMLDADRLRRAAAVFEGATVLPRLLDADLAALPPMVVQVGSEEILLPDAVRLARRARAAGVPVDLRRLDGLWHVAQTSAGSVAECTAAVDALGSALAARLAG